MKILIALSLLLFCLTGQANEPDTAYLFSYASAKNGGRNGLHLAWSRDGKEWHSIGNGFSFVKCDYGRWGAQKRMLTPYLFRGKDGAWHSVWSVNEQHPAFAYSVSTDLIHWKPQDYPVVKGTNCLRPVMRYDTAGRFYTIAYVSGDRHYQLTTSDFKTFTEAREISAVHYRDDRQTVVIGGEEYQGQIFRVAWPFIDRLIKHCEWKQHKNLQYAELMRDDAQRFAGLEPLEATVTVDSKQAKAISDLLIGVFFEDISYAADGGLYAELVQNRDFEYTPSDRGGDRKWNSLYSWELEGKNNLVELEIDTIGPIHSNNPHYVCLRLDNTVTGLALVNKGWDGIVLKKGEKYDFSVFAAADTKQTKHPMTIQLVDKNGKVVAEKTLKITDEKWKKYAVTLTASDSAERAVLKLKVSEPGWYKFDMVSLFPQQTFKGRKNGLRADLAQVIADLHPRFVRFPGGCVAHGDGIGNIYRWVNTIGPLEARKPQRNLWGYHQTAGLGYYEYFQFCEDIGAEPLPVVAAGVPCQNSGTGGAGQQGGIPMEEMKAYVQEVLDLIEYANGDAKKTKWGRVRAEAGHPAPFRLKYIGVGNEDLISEVFTERYAMICQAIQEKYPDIIVIGTVGPFYEGPDYDYGWKIATRLNLPMVDEHYYLPPGWFIHEQDYYDRYDRKKPKVYLGEYAAHVPGRHNNIETALAEALHLANVERNGDVVQMTSYAPLLAKEGYTKWNPDLIYFNNREVKPTVGYYVQQLYGQNSGNEYLPSKVQVNNPQEAVQKRIAVSVVRDSVRGDLIVKLVNLLPVEVNTLVKLTDVENIQPLAVQTVLTGKPGDRNVRPIVKEMPVGEQFPCSLPAYSFTVVRLKTK